MFSKGYKTPDNEISDFTLCNRYFGVDKIPCVICNPMRNDKNPSLGFYSRDGVKVYWKDFATNERGGIYDLLSQMWHCDYYQVLDRIADDFHTCDHKQVKVEYNSEKPGLFSQVNASDAELKVKVRDWRQYDIQYWESYGINLEWLKFADVHPVSHYFICRKNKQYVFGTDKLAYAFAEHKENKTTIKLYQPMNKNGHKWYNKHDRSVISLWEKIPKKGDKLVICSSLKDALCLWRNIGIPALALQGEGYSMSDTARNNLIGRYEKIYIIFDNDKAGLENGIRLSSETGFINIEIPQFEGGKDISDYYKIKGKTEFQRMFTNLINENYDELPF